MPTTKKVIEETSDDTSIKVAVLNNDIKHINETLVRLEGKFDVAVQSFATNQQLLSAQQESERKHREYESMFESLFSDVKELRSTDDHQQGSIDNSRRVVAVGLTLLGIAVAAATTYLGLHK